MKIKTRVILFLDLIFQPITSWLAFEKQLKGIQSLLPPKDIEILTEIKSKSKCLPKHLRGAFLYDITKMRVAGVDSFNAANVSFNKYKNIMEAENERTIR